MLVIAAFVAGAALLALRYASPDRSGEDAVRLRVEALLDYVLPEPTDVLLQVEVAQMPDQQLLEDKLTVTTATPLTPVPGHQGIGRRTWAAGEGSFVVRYGATVNVRRSPPDLKRIAAVPLRSLPGRVVHYLWPSRYCRSDQLKDFALEQFGGLSGGAAAAAMAEWTRSNLAYTPGSSDAATTANDTFQQKKGICRDFAHVMVSFARALDIPARMVSAYAWDLDPPDFHAVVEVYLAGGWYLVDPSGLAPVEGLVRIGVGRDATDIAFMTSFGTANMNNQQVSVERIG
jgi:transglutaminase-like putative cysteine protease